MSADKRIYLVTRIEPDPPAERLVRAASKSQALQHVVGPMFEVELAEADDCVRLGAAGVKVEELQS